MTGGARCKSLTRSDRDSKTGGAVRAARAGAAAALLAGQPGQAETSVIWNPGLPDSDFDSDIEVMDSDFRDRSIMMHVYP